MVTLKHLSAAVFAVAVIAAPAMAREHHAGPRYVASEDAYDAAPGPVFVGPGQGYGYGAGYSCVPAPRVGQFAGQPWTDSVPCEPSYAPGGYY